MTLSGTHKAAVHGWPSQASRNHSQEMIPCFRESASLIRCTLRVVTPMSGCPTTLSSLRYLPQYGRREGPWKTSAFFEQSLEVRKAHESCQDYVLAYCVTSSAIAVSQSLATLRAISGGQISGGISPSRFLCARSVHRPMLTADSETQKTRSFKISVGGGTTSPSGVSQSGHVRPAITLPPPSTQQEAAVPKPVE